MLGEGAEYMFGTLGSKAGPEMEKTISQLLQIYYEAKHISEQFDRQLDEMGEKDENGEFKKYETERDPFYPMIEDLHNMTNEVCKARFKFFESFLPQVKLV